MADAATWRIAPEHLDESVRALRAYADEEGASVLVCIEGEWLPILDIDEEGAEAQVWDGEAEGISVEGDCSTTLSSLPGVEPGDVRLLHDEAVDGLVVQVGARPVMAIAGAEMREIPAGLLHLEGADLSFQALRNLSQSERGRALISLDVGGSDELGTVERPEFVELFPDLVELSLSDFEEMTDLEPLTSMLSLTHLHLDGCSRLRKLDPLAKIKTLKSLDLAGCDKLEDLAPLSDLPLLDLSFEGCTRLPDLTPLVRLVSLENLDLSECGALESVALLRACGNLRSLDLTGSENVTDVNRLSECASLRELDLDDEVMAARVLAAAAVKRVDGDYVAGEVERWLELLDEAAEPTDLLEDLLPAVALGGGSAWAVDALETLVGRARQERVQNRGTWQLLLDTLLAAGDPELRRGMELALSSLPPGMPPGPIVGPALDVLARVPDSASRWARGLADAALDALLTTPRAAAVAPDAVRFYARTGHVKALDPWLEIVTQKPGSAESQSSKEKTQPDVRSIDDDPAALGGLVARLVQKQPDSPPVAQLVAALVGLAREKPDTPTLAPFVDHFAQLVRNKPDSSTVARLTDAFASALVERPAGAPAKRLVGQMTELVKMQPEHPLVAALMREIHTLINERPDSPVVTPITEMLDAARDAGVGVFARKILQHNALRDKAERAELDSFAASFDGRAAQRALIHGLVEALCAEDVLRNKPKKDVLKALEKDLVDVD